MTDSTAIISAGAFGETLAEFAYGGCNPSPQDTLINAYVAALDYIKQLEDYRQDLATQWAAAELELIRLRQKLEVTVEPTEIVSARVATSIGDSIRTDAMSQGLKVGTLLVRLLEREYGGQSG